MFRGLVGLSVATGFGLVRAVESVFARRSRPGGFGSLLPFSAAIADVWRTLTHMHTRRHKHPQTLTLKFESMLAGKLSIRIIVRKYKTSRISIEVFQISNR